MYVRRPRTLHAAAGMLSFGAAVPLGGHSDMRLQLLNGFEHDIIVAGKRNPPAPLGCKGLQREGDPL